MNANQEKEIISEKLNILHSEVYQQMMNEEKNKYDPEIKLPFNKFVHIELKKKYNLANRDGDTIKKQKRREKRPGELELKIKNNQTKEVKEIIKKHYYTSLTCISQHMEYICNEKTARKILKCLFTMTGYSNTEKVPEMLTDEAAELIKKWADHTKTLYKCCKSPEKSLDYMNTEEIIFTYETYLFVKKIILIESNSKEEYDEKISCLHKNKILNAVYAAARTLI